MSCHLEPARKRLSTDLHSKIDEKKLDNAGTETKEDSSQKLKSTSMSHLKEKLRNKAENLHLKINNSSHSDCHLYEPCPIVCLGAVSCSNFQPKSFPEEHIILAPEKIPPIFCESPPLQVPRMWTHEAPSSNNEIPQFSHGIYSNSEDENYGCRTPLSASRPQHKIFSPTEQNPCQNQNLI
jgi:hypothetical protein